MSATTKEEFPYPCLAYRQFAGAPALEHARVGERARQHQQRRTLEPMLSREENELLTRTGPGKPMGELFRR